MLVCPREKWVASGREYSLCYVLQCSDGAQVPAGSQVDRLDLTRSRCFRCWQVEVGLTIPVDVVSLVNITSGETLSCFAIPA